MVSIDRSQAQRRTQAHAPRAAQANAAQQIPATNFKRHFAIADGDCVFRVLHMDLTNRPGEQASNQRVMELRQTAANYVTEHRQALIAHPSFGGAAGVNDLYDLLMTQGQWNEDAGDMVAPILARVLGRELRILQPAQQAGVYEMNDNRIFRPQDPGLPPGRPDTGQPPIHLLHTGSGTHYEYLESRSPQADATAGSVHTPTRPAAHSVDDLGAPPSPQASPLGRMSPSKVLEEFAREPENSPTPGNLSRTSSSGSMSSSEWLDKHAREQGNRASPGNLSPTSSLKSMSSSEWLDKLAGELGNSPTPGNLSPTSSLESMSSRRWLDKLAGESGNSATPGNLSPTSSLESRSSRRWLDELAREEENSTPALRRLPDDGAQPPRKRRRKAGVRTEQQDKTTESPAQLPLGKRQVHTTKARTEIIKAFTQANNRAFETLTQDEQADEVARISRETRYRPPGIRTTLTGEGTNRVRSQKARTVISNAFTLENDRAFGALTPHEQDAEVTRISRKTGYTPSGVRTTLTGGGNKEVKTKEASTAVSNAFNEANDRAFGALTQEEQDAEVTRISRETGYNSSGVRTTLTGKGHKQVRSQASRTEVINAFTQSNDGDFRALTQHEQDAEVRRISRETGYNPSGVRTTLSGEGTKQVQSQAARTEISNAYTQVNNRAFGALTQNEQDAEVTRISRATGYILSGVQITLTGGGNKFVRTKKARAEISNAFTQTNNRAFGALTQNEQDAEVTRISRETGYRPSGVRTTLAGEGNIPVQSQAARTAIIDAFTHVNNRAFRALTQHEQDTEVTRISRETGYSPSGVRKTLTDGGYK